MRRNMYNPPSMIAASIRSNAWLAAPVLIVTAAAATIARPDTLPAPGRTTSDATVQASGAESAEPSREGSRAAADARTKSPYWSFQRLADVAVPSVRHAEQIRTPVDRFVQARL